MVPVAIKKSGICFFTMRALNFGLEGLVGSWLDSTNSKLKKDVSSIALTVGKNTQGLLVDFKKVLSVLTVRKYPNKLNHS